MDTPYNKLDLHFVLGALTEGVTLTKVLAPVCELDYTYASILDAHGINFVETDLHLRVGEPRISQGWILHITVIPAQMDDLLHSVLPHLRTAGMPFQIVKDKSVHKNLNAGKYGRFKIGKVITVSLDNQPAIEPLVHALITVTRGFTGPQVFTDFCLGSILFTRYGSFNTRIERDGFGNKERVITDPGGKLVLDRYYTPPIAPPGIPNPFLSFIQDQPRPQKLFLIGNRYMPVRLLKFDPKGSVWKALYFTWYLFPKWCAVKQARKGMFPDDYGRDTSSRLIWQRDVDKILNKSVCMPHIIGYVKTDGYDYMAMTYITGARNIRWMVADVLRSEPWTVRPFSDRAKVLSYFQQIIQSVMELHQLGVVHRDITDNNFMLGRNGKVYLIDLELAYSIRERQPDPPFGVGTDGFMSPSQAKGEMPMFEDDIYSMGALLLVMVTSGLPPRYIVEEDRAALATKLFFFTRNVRLTNLLSSCLSSDPAARPRLPLMADEITSYLNDTKNEPDGGILPVPMPGSDGRSAPAALLRFINTLGSDLVSNKNLWFSCVEDSYGRDVHPLGDKDVFAGLYRGVGGVIYLLSRLRQSGYDLGALEGKIADNLEFVRTDTMVYFEKMAPSLCYGKAGIALTIVQAIRGDFIDDDEVSRGLILRCFGELATTNDLIYGIAGQGTALLSCRQYIPVDDYTRILGTYVDILCRSQQPDGSWLKANPKFNRNEKVPGFGYGIAGILYFLLRYSSEHEYPEILDHVSRGLQYLISCAEFKKPHYQWPSSDYDESVGVWWCNGSPGIALTFLLAYRLLGKEIYADIARKALLIHPKYPIAGLFTQCHGITGLGEICLEAYSILGDVEWLERAQWIGDFILHVGKYPRPDSILWESEDNGVSFASADLMIGNSGVAHFLLRLSQPGKWGYPLLTV